MRSFSALAATAALVGAVFATEETINVVMPDPGVVAFNTPAPASDPSLASIEQLPYLQQYPYSWFQQGGYQQLQCGYGYFRNAEGYCQAETWVSRLVAVVLTFSSNTSGSIRSRAATRPSFSPSKFSLSVWHRRLRMDVRDWHERRQRRTACQCGQAWWQRHPEGLKPIRTFALRAY